MPETPYQKPDLLLLGEDHIRAYRESNGEVGYLWNGVPTLLLTTTGVKTGLARTSALIFARDGDDYLIVASLGGAPKHPSWYGNLRAQPEAEIQVKAERIAVTARTADESEKPRLWQVVNDVWPNYATYQTRTDRAIPVVVLTRERPDSIVAVSWAEQAAERSGAVQRSKARSMQQATLILDAARRLILSKGDAMTTQELAREAGVALQTFYRHFASKDELLLVVLSELIEESCRDLAAAARGLPDPIARMRFYVLATIATLDDPTGKDGAGARFVVSVHWRLQQNFPDEMAKAVKPYSDLLEAEIREAVRTGLLQPASIERSAWFINILVRSVFHHYAYASDRPPGLAEDLWRFCFDALGPGRSDP